MEATYEVDFSDFLELQVDCNLNAPNFKQTKIITIMIPFMIFFPILAITNNYTKVNGWIVLISLIVIILYSINNYRNYEKTLKQRIGRIFNIEKLDFLGQNTSIFLDKDITIEDPKMKYNIDWNNLLKIVEKDNYFFLYNTSMSAFIIPKEKLGNNKLEIIEFIKQKKKELNK